MSGKRQAMTTDMLLEEVGEFGKFQKILISMFFVMNLPIAFQILISYFMTLTPTWACNKGSRLCLFNETLPSSDTTRCRIPKTEWHFTEAKAFSVVTELGIDCGKEWQLSMISSMYFFGWGIGGLLLGYAGDKFGRKVLIFPSVFTTILVGFVIALLNNVFLIIAARFVIGFFNPGSLLQSFIIASEYAGSQHRSKAGLLVYFTLPVGYITVAIQAYFTRNWRVLHTMCTVPYILTMGFYKFIPESIKWYQLHSDNASVMEALHRVTYWNKTILPDEIDLYSPDNTIVTENSREPLRELMFSTLAQSCVWMATGTAYFGLSLVASDLGGTSYRDFIIMSLIELPAVPLAVIFSDVFGRKPASIAPLFIGGTCTVIIALVRPNGRMNIARVVVGIIGKFGLSITFNAIFTWSVELYPTHVRSIGMGYLQTVSHFGSCAAPWIAIVLKRVAPWLPYAVLGTPAIIACAVGLWLPETKFTKENKEKEGYEKVQEVQKSYYNSYFESDSKRSSLF